eukprot:c12131_g1_i1.p1 GENE.c12131_g1_i1~~c12131_g1_i1.p1  ORF type:complete len:968 (+),score=236.35 c12131_g1_i1:77-2980(+)
MSLWDVKDLRFSTHGYKALAVLVCDDLRYTKSLMNLVTSEEVESVANAIVHICDVVGRGLSLIKMMTQTEFERSTAVGTILRLQSLASRTMGTYVRQIGSLYLQLVLGDLLEKLVDNDLAGSLEVDPVRVSQDAIKDKGSVEAVIEKHKDKLVVVMQTIFDRITSPAMIEIMPRGIRAACYFISSTFDQNKDKFSPEDKSKLVGGFVMLRFFNPAIVSPETHFLLPPGQIPSEGTRRNLILIGKVLQTLANNLEFGQKEAFMSVFNPFLQQNSARMRSYLEELAHDPLQREGREPWQDVDVAPSTPLTLPSDLRHFNLTHFLTLHCITIKNREKMLKDMHELAPLPGRTNPDIDLQHVLTHLSPDIKFKISKADFRQEPTFGKLPLVSFDVRKGQVLVDPAVAEAQSRPWAESGFLFSGLPSPTGTPLLCVVLRRFNFEDFRFQASLREFIVSVCDECSRERRARRTIGSTGSLPSRLSDRIRSFSRISFLRMSMSDLTSSSFDASLSSESAPSLMTQEQFKSPPRTTTHASSPAMSSPPSPSPSLPSSLSSPLPSPPPSPLPTHASSPPAGDVVKLFDIVVDMSFSDLSDKFIRSFISHLRQLLISLPKRIGLNRLYVLNPSRLYHLTLLSLASSLPPNFFSKIEEVHSVKHLPSHALRAVIPEDSQLFLPNCFIVEMYPKKGHRHIHSRAIKVTPHSVLEIDIHSSALKGEHLLESLVQVSTNDKKKIELTFENPPAILAFQLSSSDQHTAFINCVLQSCIELSHSATTQTTFQIEKLTRGGKRQHRTVLVMKDGLFLLHKDKIKHVIPYLGMRQLTNPFPTCVRLQFEGVLGAIHRGDHQLVFKEPNHVQSFSKTVSEAITAAHQQIRADEIRLVSQSKSLTFKGVLRAVILVKLTWLPRARSRINQRKALEAHSGSAEALDSTAPRARVGTVVNHVFELPDTDSDSGSDSELKNIQVDDTAIL